MDESSREPMPLCLSSSTSIVGKTQALEPDTPEIKPQAPPTPECVTSGRQLQPLGLSFTHKKGRENTAHWVAGGQIKLT